VRALIATTVGGPLEVAEVDDPTPAPGEVVVAVEACGICGSDLHMVDVLPMPGHVLGHELAGRVAAVGEGVDGWSEGDAVMPLSLATCGTCDACRSGRPRKCASALMLGVETPGGYAQYVRAPAHDLVPLPDGLDLTTAALIEPLAVARHAVGRGGLVEGETALVIGAGPVGMAMALWLRRLGAGAVVVSDPLPGRRSMAESLGADVVVDPTAGDLTAQLVDAGVAAPSLVLECVGLPGLVDQAAGVAAVDARIVVVGVCMADDRYFPYTSMAKELDWRFAFYYCRADVDAAVDALADGTLPGRQLITGEVTLDEAPSRFDALKSGTDDTKVLIRP
jgi:(R,R)-butanediol dehydrogenase / meso-butanediol dehydrogenase / diacetyl reductase